MRKFKFSALAPLNMLLTALIAALLSGCAPDNSDQASIAAANGPPGQALYQDYCYSCHNPGIGGAPRLGDAEAWAPRAAKGADLLLQTTIEGIAPGMPPRGLCMSCSDAELAQVIDYMLVTAKSE